jgi:hypothetical protein
MIAPMLFMDPLTDTLADLIGPVVARGLVVKVGRSPQSEGEPPRYWATILDPSRGPGGGAVVGLGDGKTLIGAVRMATEPKTAAAEPLDTE